MNEFGKIIAYSIAIGVILLLAFFAACVLVLQDGKKIDDLDYEITETDKIISRISECDYNIPPQIDSVGYNHQQICPVGDGDIDEIPDSVAYLRYFYPDGNIRIEGWVAYFDNPEDDFSNQFGEWKYYDEKGNCYRKYWKYSKDNKPINQKRASEGTDR